MTADSIDLLKWPDHCVARMLAHALWVGRGHPLWDDLTDWHAAERRIEKQLASSAECLRACTTWRAMHLWHLDGRPVGRDLDFWLQAEKEVRDKSPYLVQVIAYRVWEEKGRPLWDAETDWSEAQKRMQLTT
jgi:hypothetical protein